MIITDFIPWVILALAAVYHLGWMLGFNCCAKDTEKLLQLHTKLHRLRQDRYEQDTEKLVEINKGLEQLGRDLEEMNK